MAWIRVLLIVAGASVAAAPGLAHAQGTCPGPGISPASVDVTSPRSGERVSGIVEVRGRVSATLTVSRVELLVGRAMVDSQTFPATSSAGFALIWDARRSPPGVTSLQVVACGQGVGGALVQGSSTVSVEVVDPAPPTSSRSLAPSTTMISTSTSVLRSTTTSSASSTTSSSTTRTSTTLRSVTATELRPGFVAPEAGPPGRLLPTAPAEEEESRSRPVWVGAVIGAAGVAGLYFSRTVPGRRLDGQGRG